LPLVTIEGPPRSGPFSWIADSTLRVGYRSDIASLLCARLRTVRACDLHMGDRTLQQTDRAGATLEIVSALANPT
jgi:hypothetical protein